MARNAGKLDRRVVIQTNAPTKDAGGANVDSLSTHATVWAERTDVGGSQGEDAGGLVSQLNTNWRIRYLSTVTTKMLITFESQTWEIISIQELGRREAMLLTCKALGI